MGKHCEGLEEPDPDSDGVIDETLPVEEERTRTRTERGRVTLHHTLFVEAS